VGDWLAERFALLAVTFQNWMVVARAIVIALSMIIS